MKDSGTGDNALVKVFEYGNTPVNFRMEDGVVMVNATAMARHFGKRPVDYLRLPSTVELLGAIVRKSHICEQKLAMTAKGSPEYGGGTWMHEDVAIDFAQWLSVDFRLWVNDRIRELLRYGMSVTPEVVEHAADDPRFVLGVVDRLREGYAEGIRLREENDRLLDTLEVQAHKVEFYDKVHRCRRERENRRIYRISQIAAELGMTGAELNSILEEKGVQRRCGHIWVPTRAYDGKGYTCKRTFRNGFDEDGEPVFCTFTVWTSKGRELILGLFE